MLSLLVVALLGVDGVVVPCGTALCIGGNQQPVTLGGTVQVNQGPRPDGGFAELQPVTQGASLVLAGTQSDPNDGGFASLPDIIVRTTNTRASGGPPVVSYRQNQVEFGRIDPNGTLAMQGFASTDGGAAAFGALTSSSALTSGTFACDGGTPAPTFTVKSGVHCVCGGQGAACTVSSTTATAHCVAGDTVGVGYLCL